MAAPVELATGAGGLLVRGVPRLRRMSSCPQAAGCALPIGGCGVTPGLMDAHVHFASGGANRLHNLDMSYPNVE